MRPLFLATISTAIGLAYAVLRYHQAFFGDDPTDQLPLYLLNKALSVAALVMIGLAVGARAMSQRLGRFGAGLLRDRRAIGLTGFGLAAVHSAISFVLLTPGYFGKFYPPGAGRMNLVGELSTLAGVAALTLLVWLACLSSSHDRRPHPAMRWLGVSALALTATHVAVMGWAGWWAPSDWPGGLPPITLLSFAIAAAGLALGLVPGGRRG